MSTPVATELGPGSPPGRRGTAAGALPAGAPQPGSNATSTVALGEAGGWIVGAGLASLVFGLGLTAYRRYSSWT